jgi:propionyl-CoA carboxylase beta chain
VRALANESLSAEDLGGALVHSVTSGLADGVYDNDVEALLQLRRFIDFLPSSNAAELPEWPSFDDPERIEMSLDTLVPEDPTRSYDVKELIVKTVDEGDFFEIQEAHAQNIVIGFGRIAGRPIGLIANQPLVLGGVLDTSACSKAARFVRFCDCFNIPLVTFVDVPGFLPGIAQEHGGLAKAGAKLLFSYAQATVPKITITLRKGFGAAFAIMGSKHLRGDRAYAWPSAQIALMGVQGAVAILHPGESEDREMIAERARDYEACVLSPIVAAACGLIDEIILPSETRPRIARALAALRSKHVDNPVRKHDNIPL